MTGSMTLREIKAKLREAFQNAEGDPLQLLENSVQKRRKRDVPADSEIIQSLRKIIQSAPKRLPKKRPA